MSGDAAEPTSKSFFRKGEEVFLRRRCSSDYDPKLALRWPSAVRCRRRRRAAGHGSCLTNGVFDLVHPGHASYLAAARKASWRAPAPLCRPELRPQLRATEGQPPADPSTRWLPRVQSGATAAVDGSRRLSGQAPGAGRSLALRPRHLFKAVDYTGGDTGPGGARAPSPGIRAKIRLPALPPRFQHDPVDRPDPGRRQLVTVARAPSPCASSFSDRAAAPMPRRSCSPRQAGGLGPRPGGRDLFRPGRRPASSRWGRASACRRGSSTRRRSRPSSRARARPASSRPSARVSRPGRARRLHAGAQARLPRAFAGRIINLHPSLLPSFPGLDGIGQACAPG